MKDKLQYLEIAEQQGIADVQEFRPDHEAGQASFNPSVTVGRLCMVIPGAGPLVDFPGNQSGEMVPARTTVRLGESHAGREVVLAFEEGDGERPIILGILHERCAAAPECDPATSSAAPEPKQDPERVFITAGQEITLRCGKASITLTRAGKLLIEGEYVVSRSAGVNKIRGGSVQIN